MLQRIVGFLATRWQLMAAIVAMLVLLGINSVLTIQKSEDPIVRFPFANTVVVVPGANAAQIEQLVTRRIEKAIRKIDDIKDIYSESFDGVANIGVEFEWGVDTENKFDQVVREVNAIRGDLPNSIQSIEFIRADSSLASVAQIALVGNGANARALEAAAVDLRDTLERLPGVQSSEIWGLPPTELRVSLDLDRLAAYRISPFNVLNAVKQQGLNSTVGAVEDGRRRFNIQRTGRFRTLDDVRAITLLARDGRSVTLADVAEVSWASGEDRHLTRLNQKQAVFLTVRSKLKSDIFDVRANVARAVDDFRTRIPPDATLTMPFDQSRNVAKRLGNLGRDVLIAILIVLLTLLPLGFRASLVVMMSIPLSLAIGVIAIQLCGFSLNQLSIAGFVLALGLLVDDSIVVTEIIVRRIKEGMAPREAAICGMGEIDAAVIGCTATIILAFLPLLFLPESSGGFLRSLPAAVLATVAASLVVSLTVIPFLAGYVLRRHDGHSDNRALALTMGAIHKFYSPVLERAMNRPKTTVVIGLLCCALSSLLIPILGFSLFPESDSPQFMVEVEAQQGSALIETDKAVRFAERVLAKHEEIEWVMSNTGQGNPRVYYNFAPQRLRTTTGALFISFKAWDPQQGAAFIDGLRAELAAYAGAKFSVRRFENGPPIDAPIVVRVIGKDLATLDALADRVVATINATQGTREVDNRQSVRQIDLDFDVDQSKLGFFGVAPGAVDQSLSIVINGAKAADFYDTSGQSFPVIIRALSDNHFATADLSKLYVWNASGAAIPLDQIVRVGFTSAPSQITRYQQERVIIIRAYAQPGFLPVDLARKIEGKLAMIDLPVGYRFQLGGQAEAAAASFSGLGVTLLIAIFGILIVLLWEFGSFAQALVVAFVIPFGISGGLIALWIAGYSLSFTAAIGFVALIGIEIKNSILLVDLANQLRVAGTELRRAVIQAGEERFLPVLLTSLTAVGGLIPLILEKSALYSPLAVVIAGGLVSSTLVARIVTPVVYLLLVGRSEGKSLVQNSLARS